MDDMTAIAMLSMCCAWVNEEFDREFDLAERSACENNAWGIFRLGICYYYGHGVSQDYDRAFDLFQESAQMGHTRAAELVGDCYRYGEGVVRNDVKAVQHYQQAAQQGNPLSLSRLASAYEEGWCGLAVDKAQAEALRNKSRELIHHS